MNSQTLISVSCISFFLPRRIFLEISFVFWLLGVNSFVALQIAWPEREPLRIQRLCTSIGRGIPLEQKGVDGILWRKYARFVFSLLYILLLFHPLERGEGAGCLLGGGITFYISERLHFLFSDTFSSPSRSTSQITIKCVRSAKWSVFLLTSLFSFFTQHTNALTNPEIYSERVLIQFSCQGKFIFNEIKKFIILVSPLCI